MEAVEELALHLFVGFLVDLSPFESRFCVCQLGADPRWIVKLRLSLVDDLLEHPGEPAHRRERKGQESADQAHQATAGITSRTKL
jgi:hypothetical protein